MNLATKGEWNLDTIIKDEFYNKDAEISWMQKGCMNAMTTEAHTIANTLFMTRLMESNHVQIQTECR